MRRAAMAVVIGGYAFGGLGVTGPGTGQAEAQPQAEAGARQVAGTKVVTYRGYQLTVPAAWPVYQLDRDPTRCVRYDINAVYVGTPGDSQNCPPHLVGRTETVSIGTRPAAIWQRAGSPGAAAVPGRILQSAARRTYGMAMPSSALSVTATYGGDPALIKRVLASLREISLQSARMTAPGYVSHAAGTGAAPREAAPAGTSSPSPAAVRAVPVLVQASRPVLVQASRPVLVQASRPVPVPVPVQGPVPVQAARPLATAWPGPRPAPAGAASPSPSPSPAPSAPATVPPRKPPLPGFDACTAPSLAVMRAWRQKYAATGIYIGGREMACDYGNLTPQWITAAEGLGWSLLPTYVGPQAPCNTFSGKISGKLATAAKQGRAAALDAIADATMFGMGKGTPIYYDMEAYDESNGGCIRSVLTFLDSWTRQLNLQGYVSGVYSSAGSAVIDLATNNQVNGHPLAEPQAIWFALWDGNRDLSGSGYLTGGRWVPAERSKQYKGTHWVKIRKFGLWVDSDLVNSPAVR